MDLTTGSVLFALFMIGWALCRCPHAWELVDKTELPSPIETGAKAGLTTISHFPSDAVKMMSKRLIIVIRCPKCGVAKVLRES